MWQEQRKMHTIGVLEAAFPNAVPVVGPWRTKHMHRHVVFYEDLVSLIHHSRRGAYKLTVPLE
jgi:hypothetical protein